MPHRRTAAPPHRRTAAPPNTVKSLGLILALAIALGTFGSAQAHQKGDFIVRLGVIGTYIDKIPSERMVGGLATPAMEMRLAAGLEAAAEIDFERLIADGWDPASVQQLRAWPLDWAGVNIRSMENALAPTWNMTWFMTNNLALDVAAGIYKHDIKLGYSGENQDTLRQVNGLRFAETKQEQLAVGLVYYPLGNLVSRIHPYVSLGTSYTKVTTTPHRDWINLESSRLDEALLLATIIEDSATAFVEAGIARDLANGRANIDADLEAGRISAVDALLARQRLENVAAAQREILAEEVAEIRQAIANEETESRLLLEQDAARRTHFYSWKVNARVGADFNLTDKFLLTAQAGYTSVDNVGYWNYLLGFGIKL